LKKRISHYFSLILSFILFSVIQNGHAQSFLNHKEYTIEDRLPSSNIYRVLEDKSGFIWVATDQGVAKFNGYSFRHFTAKDGLPSDDVWKLSEDKNGRIWLSTFNEIGYIFEDKYYSILVPEGIKTNGILTHYIFQQDSIERHYVEVRLNKSLLEIVNDSIFKIEHKVIEENVGFKKENFHAILGIDNEGAESYLFAKGKNSKISIFLSSKNKKGLLEERHRIDLDKDVTPNKFQFHFFPEHDLIILFIEDKVYSFDFKKLETLKSFEALKLGNTFKTFHLNHDELIIKGIKNYVYNVKTRKIRLFKLPIDDVTTSIQEDKRGNIWMSSKKGLRYFSMEAGFISNLKHSNIKSEDSFLCVYKDLKGRIWFGTDVGGLFYLDSLNKLHFIEILLDNIELTKDVLAIADNPIGGIIVGGNFGILNITEEEIFVGRVERKLSSLASRGMSIEDQENFTPLAVKDIYFSEKEEVHIGSSVGYHIFSETFSIGLNKRKDRTERVYSIIHTSEGITYLGRKSGLYQIKDGNEKLILSTPICTLYHDANGLWVGTEGNGMYLIKDEKQIHFPGTAEKTIRAINPDKEGNIWFITKNDICRISVKDKYELKFSATANGILVNSFNNFIIKNQTVYFCTKTGIQTIPISLFDWEKRNQELFFTNLHINGTSVELKDYYNLSNHENCLEIEYVSLEYNKPDDVTYEYKMEGLDTLWRKSNSLKQDFWFLQPGTYTFNLRAGLNSQNISEIKKITFYIAAPWWQKVWVWLLIAFSFVISVGYIFNLRSKKVIEEERKKAKIEKQITNMRLQVLQSQMNPHFIFNSLQAIQDYIFDRNEEQANKYLVKFSRLMRLILESSRKKFILLSEELQLIDLYVSLEQLRFSEQFSYVLSLGENIDKKSLLIPSMLIQPFIENAVNHGLFHKKDGKGILELSIEKFENSLIIIVKDNGIGIEAARKIKQKMNRKEASRALEIVNERTNLYNKTRTEDVNFKIEDNLNQQGEIIGTVVTLKLILSIDNFVVKQE